MTPEETLRVLLNEARAACAPDSGLRSPWWDNLAGALEDYDAAMAKSDTADSATGVALTCDNGEERERALAIIEATISAEERARDERMYSGDDLSASRCSHAIAALAKVRRSLVAPASPVAPLVSSESPPEPAGDEWEPCPGSGLLVGTDRDAAGFWKCSECGVDVLAEPSLNAAALIDHSRKVDE